MDVQFPPSLRATLDRHLTGKSRNDLAARARRLSETYRAGGGSDATVLQPDDALAYAVTRMPATYAALHSACAELARRCPGFAPAALFDCGAGPGTASWAALAVWPGIATPVMLDHNPVFLDLARRLAVDAPALSRAQHVTGAVKDWQPDASMRFDLTLLGYALAEIPADESAATLDKLWAACNGAFVIVEPGTPDGYARILRARRHLIEAGAVIAAPCPHAGPCPLMPPDWCHFSTRLPRSRDHLLVKCAEVPFEDEKFSYVIATRPELAHQPYTARVIAPAAKTKVGVGLKLCMADGAARVIVTPRRDKPAFTALRKKDWGDTVV